MEMDNLPVYVNHDGRVVISSLDVAKIFKVSHERLGEKIKENYVPAFYGDFFVLFDSGSSAWEMTPYGFILLLSDPSWIPEEILEAEDWSETKNHLINAVWKSPEELASLHEKEPDHGNG